MYGEDRSRWIPPHRYAEVANRYRALEARYQDTERRMRALAGLEPQANPQHLELRRQFAEVFPELGSLLDPQNAQVLTAVLQLAQSGQLNEVLGTTQSYWNRHAHTMARDAVHAYAKAVGVDAKQLPPRAVNRMALQLKAFIEEDDTGERQQRFEMGDPTLIEECIADAQGIWVDPARTALNNNAARNAEQNRRLPDRGPAGGVPPTQPTRRTRQETREAARQFVLQNR